MNNNTKTKNGVFTPIDKNGDRLNFKRKNVEIIRGSIDQRGTDWSAIVKINSVLYVVTGAECGAEGCKCDALIEKVDSL